MPGSWKGILTRVWLGSTFIWFAAGQDDETPCGEQFTSQGVCTWTGSCPITGCTDQCVADLGVGYARAVVSDRAYGESWFQTCPRLAQIVNVVAAETPNLSVGSNETEEQLSARLTGQSSLGMVLVPSSLIQRKCTKESSESCLHPRQVNRHLQQDEELTSARQTCPQPEVIDEASTLMFALAEDLQAIFSADASGDPLTSTQQDLAYILDSPNEFAVLLDYMHNPQKLKDYMETSCATAAVPASAFRFYDEHLADGSPPVTSEFTVCRDTFGGLEQHAQLLTIASSVCNPPFLGGDASATQPSCFATLPETPWTPTSQECAAALARAYNISDAPLRAAATSMTSLQEMCRSRSSKAACASVDGSMQRESIQAAWDMFPSRENLTNTGSQAPTSAAPLTFASSPADDDSTEEVDSEPVTGQVQSPMEDRSGSFQVAVLVQSRWLFTLCFLLVA